MGSAVRLRMTPLQIELFGTMSVWLSGVRMVVDTRLMRFTVPATPAASISSPRSYGRVPRMSPPAARFASVFWSAKPTAKPAMPRPASSGASCTPSWVRMTPMPTSMTPVTANRDTVARMSWLHCERRTARGAERATDVPAREPADEARCPAEREEREHDQQQLEQPLRRLDREELRGVCAPGPDQAAQHAPAEDVGRDAARGQDQRHTQVGILEAK